MPEFRDRDTRKLYPGAITEGQPPAAGGWVMTWKQVCAYAMGAEGSGHSGAIVNGKCITTGTKTEINAYAAGPP